MFDENDVPKYKKKKEQKSKANKRSDHKHNYEKIILVGSLFGSRWAYKCCVCGRMKGMSAGSCREGLLKERPYTHISAADYLTAEEAHWKYPDVSIYEQLKDENGYTLWGDNDMQKIKFNE